MEFDFLPEKGLRQELLGSYLGPVFVPEERNLLLYGPSGIGETHVAIAIAYKAIQHGLDARFVTAAHLIDELSSASRDGWLRQVLAPYTHPGCWWSTRWVICCRVPTPPTYCSKW